MGIETYNPAAYATPSIQPRPVMIHTRIVGTGSYLPERVVSNAEAAGTLGIAPSMITRLTGIVERRWADPSQASSDLAVEACRRAMDAAGINQSAIEAIVLSTTSPDTVFPSTACLLQRKLGCPGGSAFDLSASCSGFLYGLSMADAMIRSGQLTQCLVVAAEVKSRTLDPDDADTALLFGDGAGAVVVRAEHGASRPDRGILGLRIHAEGARHDLIRIPVGGSRMPATEATFNRPGTTLRMRGGPLFRLAVKKLDQAIRDLLKEFGVTLDDVAYLVLHQANGRILSSLTAKLELPASKICSVIERLGNTSSASVPVALDHAVRAGKIMPQDLVVLGSFGGGITWATGLIRW
ncbi:MAG: 3-oxoacyl-[acyl-carrier-protein] synthase 3 [Nitrospira sp.]